MLAGRMRLAAIVILMTAMAGCGGKSKPSEVAAKPRQQAQQDAPPRRSGRPHRGP